MAITTLLFCSNKMRWGWHLALASTFPSVLYCQGNLLFLISPDSWAFLCEPGDGNLLSSEDLPLQIY